MEHSGLVTDNIHKTGYAKIVSLVRLTDREVIHETIFQSILEGSLQTSKHIEDESFFNCKVSNEIKAYTI